MSSQSKSQGAVLTDWLASAIQAGASDLHLVAGYRPTLRLHGGLDELDAPQLDADTIRTIIMAACPEHAQRQLEQERNTDYALEQMIDGRPHRFRVNLFVNGPNLGACLRIVPDDIPDFSWAGFPRDLAERLARLRNGLVLLTGVTGAGKTTSLAMIVNLLNQEGGYRIITVEDPVEYIFPKNPASIITQREVGTDVSSFADGLKYGLRQDPDVILVGEIRDRETARMVLSAAETGHLVFSTLHTRDAKGAISRFADLFPSGVQGEVRSQLAMSLRAVISQILLPSSVPGAKRELALEIMFNNAPISAAIRTGKLESIETNLQTGRSDGMLTLDESIKRLVVAGSVARQTASRFVSDLRILS